MAALLSCHKALEFLDFAAALAGDFSITPDTSLQEGVTDTSSQEQQLDISEQNAEQPTSSVKPKRASATQNLSHAVEQSLDAVVDLLVSFL